MIRRTWISRTLAAGVGAAAGWPPIRPSAVADDPEFLGIKDVASFGARGDGTTDDHAAIQRALDSGLASAKPTVIGFGPGIYVLGAPLEIHSNTTLLGVGAVPRYGLYPNAPTMPVTLQPGAGFPRDGILLDARRASNTHIEAIEVLGDGDRGPNQTNASTTGIAYGTADMPNAAALWSNHLVRNCSIAGHRRGVHAKEASYQWWEWNNIACCWEAGVAFEQWCGDSSLAGTYVNRCNALLPLGAPADQGIGLLLGHGCGNISVIGGKIENNGRGIRIFEGWGINLVGLQFHDNGHYQLGIFGGARPASSIQLNGCRFLCGGATLKGNGGTHVHMEAQGTGKASVAVTGCSFKAGKVETAVDFDMTGSRGPDHVLRALGTGTVSALLVGNDLDDGAVLGAESAILFESGLLPASELLFGANLGGAGKQMLSGTLRSA